MMKRLLMVLSWLGIGVMFAGTALGGNIPMSGQRGKNKGSSSASSGDFLREDQSIAFALAGMSNASSSTPVSINDDAASEDTGEHERTPLYRAAMMNDAPAVEQLLNEGADVHAVVSSTGRTLLHLAAQDGHADVLEVLLRHGGNVRAADEYGATPLHSVAFWNRLAVVNFLVRAEADLNARDVLGNTPLHEAAAQGHTKMALLLIAAGADKNAKNKQGKTPADLANAKGKADVAAAIMSEQHLSMLCILCHSVGSYPSMASMRGDNTTSGSVEGAGQVAAASDLGAISLNDYLAPVLRSSPAFSSKDDAESVNTAKKGKTKGKRKKTNTRTKAS